MNGSFHIADLIVKKIRGKSTPEELRELDAWINSDPGNRETFERATDPKNQLKKLEIYRLLDGEEVWSGLEEKLFPAKAITFNPRRFMAFAAGILLPVLIAGAAYLFFIKPAPTSLADLDAVYKPGTQKATLILSDGGSVSLEGELAPTELEEGNVKIRNTDNFLSYSEEPGRRKTGKTLYNELRTPRGGGYSLKLADGTAVWINAGSSLRFPVAFNDSVREVFLEGEAYFEVTHTGNPFIVNSGQMDVRVLGTSFNITAFPDEREFITTLVEGSVRVEIAGQDNRILAGEVLKPDHQAVLDMTDKAISVAAVKTSYYTSWMRGKIEFDNENLDIVMKRLARWYDFEYRFENREAMQYHFTARLDREATISSILEMMEMTTDVKFKYNKGIITID